MQWDYRTLVVGTGGWLARGDVDAAAIDDTLAQYGQHEFELVAAIPVSDGSVGTASIALFFKRPSKSE